MEDVTILIQGRISQESYNFYVNNYPNSNIVVSTWENHTLDTSNFPSNLKLITAKLPKESGYQNVNYQVESTVNGLMCVRTPYVIKIRGDEYYSNLEYILSQIKLNPKKVHSCPVWFRHWEFMNYHISDHLIAGTTENLKLMFESTKYNLDNFLLYHIRDGKPQLYWEPEINITRSYLMAKHPDKFEKVDGRILMIENFEILDMQMMEPYKVVANIFKRKWADGFIPERNFSISNIKQLLISEKEAYATDITPRKLKR